MKRIVLALALSVAAVSHAFAADLPERAPPPPPYSPPAQAPATYIPAPEPSYNFGGIYAGINGGYGLGSSTWTVASTSTCPSCTTGSFKTDGFLVGGTLGVNFQAGQIVFGPEADLDWTDFKGHVAPA